MHKLIVALFIALTITSCSTPIVHETASGRPEVSIKAPAESVKAAFVGVAINAGYSLKTDTPLQVVLERDTNNVAALLLLSSRYDPTVKARLTLTFLSVPPMTRTIADLNAVTNAGSAFERLTPLNNGPDSAAVQRVLIDIKKGLEAGKSVAVVTAETVAAMEERRRAASSTVQ